ncbi:MAG: M3 family metallopeptidase [Phycisphaerae bacterium]|nr:M3 family metallopeptidase [Phycisphaerae bacterium]
MSALTGASNIPADSPVAAALHQAEAAVEAIVGVSPSQRNFDNTVGAMDDLMVRLENETEMIQFMKDVSTDAAARDRGQRAAKDVSDWYTDLATREDLYQAVKDYAETKPSLTGEKARLLEHTLRDYRRSGMDLPKPQRDKLNELQKQMTELSLQFQANVRDDDAVVLLTRDELRGMDDEFIAGLPKSGEMFICNLEYPTYLPILDFCEVEATRAKMWLARHRKGGKKNALVLEKILKLRAECAAMLGYKSDVDYQTETRMAKNAAAVKKFYDELRPVVRKKAAVEFADYTDAKRKHTGDAKTTLKPWDIAFYENRLKQERFAVDARKVQEYFPLDRATEGLFAITQKIYGIEYREITKEAASKLGQPLWHPEVRVFEVHDVAKKELLGTFYLDLFPRPNKYSHAAQFGLRSRKKWTDGTVQKPVVALVCNFTKPTGDKPSLLTHDEVETYFHEFGHCLHSILTEAELASLGGTRCARDFVEAPSQMFENWVWLPESLTTFARHYKTGEPLPKEMIDGMYAARTFGKGLWAERQIFFGLLDQTYHLAPGGEVDTTKVAGDVFADVMQFGRIDEIWPQAAFGHLMGYNSAYYGYMWSLVYAADMFQRFEQGGMLSAEVGRDYRAKILAKGGTMEDMDMVRAFLGREPKKEPFLKYLGLN